MSKSYFPRDFCCSAHSLAPGGEPLYLDTGSRWEPCGEGRSCEVEFINRSPEPLALGRVLLFDIDLGAKTIDVYRQGFFMPSDSAGFYRLRAGEPAPEESPWKPVDEGEYRFTSHTVAVLKHIDSEDLLLLGFLSFERFQGYWVFDTSGDTIRLQACLRLEGRRVAPGERLELGRFMVLEGGDFSACLAAYTETIGALYGARVPKRTLTGWTDWQYYREEKDAGVILENVEELRRLRQAGYPLNTVVIDGGWCEHASEWLQPYAKFPDIRRLCHTIRDAGLVPGLWLAPYLTNVATEVARNHPEWMLMDTETGKPLFKERSNVGPCHVLDFTVPEALEWLRGIVRTMVRDWRIGYLKLDGPCMAHYAGGLFHDPGVTAVEQVRRSLAVIREECGEDVLVEGEGLYGASIGFVDVQRTMQDTHPCWHLLESGTPLLKENLGNDLLSSFMNGRLWHVHRENVVLRDFPSPFHAGKTRNPEAVESMLTENELRSQLSAAALAGGAMLLTDPLPLLRRSPERLGLIGQFLPPYEGARCEPLDPFNGERFPSQYLLRVDRPFGDWEVLGVFNWGEVPRDFEVELPERMRDAERHAFEFWERRWLGIVRSHFTVRDVPAHGCRLIGLRPVLRETDGALMPQLVGMDTHLLQGAVELETVETSAAKLSMVINHFDPAERSLFVYVPEERTLIRLLSDTENLLIDDRYAPIIRLRFSTGGQRAFFTFQWMRSTVE